MPIELDLASALERIPTGARIVATGACGAPTTLLRGLNAWAAAHPGATLCSGLHVDPDPPFLGAVDAGHLGYRTWHVLGPVRRLVASGKAHYVPARASAVPRVLSAWRPDVALVRVTPPDADGRCSLGPSTAYALDAVRLAPLVIAEVDPDLPWTYGDSCVDAAQIDVFVPSEAPCPEYSPGEPDAVSRRIAEHLLGLLPRDPVLQLGIGGVPEAITALLAEHDLGAVRFVGMATDQMLALLEAGRLDPAARMPDPAIFAVDALGTRRLLSACDRNPAIGLYPSSAGHDTVALSRRERFVSINSAIEVDLSGQINAETVAGRQLSGVGGSLDYVETAYHSDGGLRITALAATAREASRIVPRLGEGSVVTVPRAMADVVVTEYGVATLTGLTLAERAEALIAIADPAHRDALADAYDSLKGTTT